MHNTLKRLSDNYENEEFLLGDPSWFMHQVQGELNQEAMAFIASCFSYGSRQQFMQKIQNILDHSRGEMFLWVKERRYNTMIPDDDKCFYRLYTNRMVRQLFDKLSQTYISYGSLKSLIATDDRPQNPHNRDCKIPAISALETLTNTFGGKIIPHSTSSACKRLCMFLRWMARDDSPVDLGIWADIMDKRTLIMPLDTHVMQQANRLKLISTKTTSMTTAKKLTEAVANIFPDDPLKADFALFGYGVNK